MGTDVRKPMLVAVWPWFGTQERVAIKANANAGAKNHECWYQEVVVIT